MEPKDLNLVLQFLPESESLLQQFATAAASPSAREAVERTQSTYTFKNITIAHESLHFSPFFAHKRAQRYPDFIYSTSTTHPSRTVRHVKVNGAWSKAALDACKWWLQRESNEPLALTWTTELNHIDKVPLCLSDFPTLWHLAIHTSQPLRHFTFNEHVMYNNLEYIDLKSAQFLSDLSFVEQCPHLKGLYAWDTGVSDFSILSHCPLLEVLIFSVSSYLPTLTMKNIHCIGNLRHLRVLKLALPRLDSLEWLKECTSLEEVALIGFSGVNDWAPLRALSKLRLLHITSTAFNDLSSFITSSSPSSSPNFTSTFVSIDATRTTFFENKLEELSLAMCNGITDFTLIGKLRRLRSLRLVQSSVHDITWMANCTQLEILELGYCPQLTSLQTLSSLHLLRVLKLSQVRVEDMSWLAQCTHLEEVELKLLRRVRELDGLGGLSNLHILRIYDLPIQDITPITSNVNLKILHLEYCTEIKRFAPLSALTQLEELNLRGCHQLTHLDWIAPLASLKYLSIERCTLITDCSPIRHLPHLHILNIAYCRCEHLEWLSCCPEVRLVHTLLSMKYDSMKNKKGEYIIFQSPC